MNSTNNHYNSKIEQIKINLERNGWVLDTHQSFYGQPDMVRNITAFLKTPLKSKGSEYSIAFEAKYPCVLSINYDQTGPDYFTADYWIQTCDDSKEFNSNIFGNDVRIHQQNAVNGSTDILGSVTQQMHNNFRWFTINSKNK
jgi:hypothetical protein